MTKIRERELTEGLIMAEWDNFLGAVDPLKRFGDVQKFEMMKAFFAGFASAAGTIDAAMNTASGMEDEEAGAQVLATTMELIRKDLAAFSEAQRQLAAKMGIKTTRVTAGDGLTTPGPGRDS